MITPTDSQAVLIAEIADLRRECATYRKAAEAWRDTPPTEIDEDTAFDYQYVAKEILAGRGPNVQKGKYQSRAGARYIYHYEPQADPRAVVCPVCYAPIGVPCMGMREDLTVDYCPGRKNEVVDPEPFV